ncbi:MAG: hypothetical protein D3914_03555 [Candidatus Electrothrix sp. LOE2]|nr:hypothetical protein [Candidatus Electrothrix sp. LOE2]
MFSWKDSLGKNLPDVKKQLACSTSFFSFSGGKKTRGAVDEEMFHVKHKKIFTALAEWCSILGKVKINNRHSVLLSCFFFRKPDPT